jgi:hypothetical protein
MDIILKCSTLMIISPILNITYSKGRQDEGLFHPSVPSSIRPSVPSWFVYSDEVEKTVEYGCGGCLHIINNFYLLHVDGVGYAK